MKFLKSALVLAALSLACAPASAHMVKPIPFENIGSLQDVVEARFPRGTPPAIAQITCNVQTGVASVGGPCVTPTATCNGDKLSATITVTTTGTNASVTVFSNQFSGSDVGKALLIPNAGSGGGTFSGYINAVGAFNGTSQTLTMDRNTGSALTSQSKLVYYGTDTSPAFKAFNTWARANQGSSQVVLTVPNGATCWFALVQSITGAGILSAYFSGIKDLIVEGTGATFDSIGGNSPWYGAQGQIEQGLASASGQSARLKSVSASASVVELTAASYAAGYISRFTVGNPVMVSGMDIQTGYNQNYGVPSNHQFFDHRIITAICNNSGPCVGTATITLDRPLTYTLLDTWPEYYAGASGQTDQGGPATIYAFNPHWNASFEFRGLTINDSQQTYAPGRNVTWRNVTWNSPNGTVPSMNENFNVYNSVLNITSAGWEVDKLVTNLTIDGLTGAAGGVVTRIDWQSPSPANMVMANANLGNVFGSPKNATITDTHFDLFRPGAWTNGASTGPLVCTRCDVTDFQASGGLNQNFAQSAYSMSGGVVTVANSNNVGANGPPHRVFVPGGNVYYQTSGYVTVGLIQTLAQTQDATNVYTQTSEAGGFPSIAGYSPQWLVHPAPQFTCDACTGDPEIVAVTTQSGATPGAPLSSFGKRNYAPTVNQSVAGYIYARGKLIDLTIDVTTAAVGTGSLVLNPTEQFFLNMMDQATWTNFNWFPIINLKQAGKRVISPSGVTCDTGGGPVAGPCSGDTINAPSGGAGGYPPSTAWLVERIAPSVFGSTFPGTFTVTPIFSMTIRTNQGVVP